MAMMNADYGTSTGGAGRAPVPPQNTFVTPLQSAQERISLAAVRAEQVAERLCGGILKEAPGAKLSSVADGLFGNIEQSGRIMDENAERVIEALRRIEASLPA